MGRPDKIDDLLQRVRACVDEAKYRVTLHADQRMKQRGVTLPEALHVLRTGWHEKRKDSFDEVFQTWNYAIRSQTYEDRSVRVIVSFDEAEQVVVITVIDLDLDE